VVTEARFDTAEAVPVLKFRAVRPLTREEWEAAKDAAASDDAQRAIEFKMVVRTAKAEPTTAAYSEEAPKPKAALFGGAAVPARDADDEDEVIEEPVKRTSKKATAPVPAAKSSAADIMSAWGVDDDE
jgi:hypothetical protein